jgi:hypothetical protein
LSIFVIELPGVMYLRFLSTHGAFHEESGAIECRNPHKLWERYLVSLIAIGVRAICLFFIVTVIINYNRLVFFGATTGSSPLSLLICATRLFIALWLVKMELNLPKKKITLNKVPSCSIL